jgi:hypothetical protein
LRSVLNGLVGQFRRGRVRFQPCTVDALQFVPLFLCKNEDIAANTNIHVDASSLEAIWSVGPEHFDLQLGIEPADVAGNNAHVMHGFKVTLDTALPDTGVQ